MFDQERKNKIKFQNKKKVYSRNTSKGEGRSR